MRWRQPPARALFRGPILLCACLLAIGGCRPNDPATETASAPIAEGEWQIDSVPAVVVGTEASGVLFNMVSKAVRFADGRIAVADGSASSRISLFSPEGIFERELTWFGSDGSVTRTKPVRHVDLQQFEAFNPWIPLQHGFYLVRSEVLAGSIGNRRAFDPNARILLMTEDEIVADTLISFHRGFLPYRYQGWPGLVNYIPFIEPPPGGSWAVSGDSLVATVDGVLGAIHLYRMAERGAAIARSHGLEWSPQSVNARELLANSMPSLTRSRHPGASMSDFTVYAPEFESRIGGMVLEPSGRVLIRLQEWGTSELPGEDDRGTPAAPQEEEWLVVDLERGVVGEVRFPAGFRLVQVMGSLYLGIHRDEWDVESVRLYTGPNIRQRQPVEIGVTR